MRKKLTVNFTPSLNLVELEYRNLQTAFSTGVANSDISSISDPAIELDDYELTRQLGIPIIVVCNKVIDGMWSHF